MVRHFRCPRGKLALLMRRPSHRAGRGDLRVVAGQGGFANQSNITCRGRGGLAFLCPLDHGRAAVLNRRTESAGRNHVPHLKGDHLIINGVTFRTDLQAIDWPALKSDLAADRFDNGRSADALRRSFEASPLVAIAWSGGRVVGTARALTDGVCNAYIVDVWTHSAFRRRGIGREMMSLLTGRLRGQHVALFTSDAAAFYAAIDFRPEEGGLSRVIGRWLEHDA